MNPSMLLLNQTPYLVPSMRGTTTSCQHRGGNDLSRLQNVNVSLTDTLSKQRYDPTTRHRDTNMDLRFLGILNTPYYWTNAMVIINRRTLMTSSLGNYSIKTPSVTLDTAKTIYRRLAIRKSVCTSFLTLNMMDDIKYA